MVFSNKWKRRFLRARDKESPVLQAKVFKVITCGICIFAKNCATTDHLLYIGP